MRHGLPEIFGRGVTSLAGEPDRMGRLEALHHQGELRSRAAPPPAEPVGGVPPLLHHLGDQPICVVDGAVGSSREPNLHPPPRLEEPVALGGVKRSHIKPPPPASPTVYLEPDPHSVARIRGMVGFSNRSTAEESGPALPLDADQQQKSLSQKCEGDTNLEDPRRHPSFPSGSLGRQARARTPPSIPRRSSAKPTSRKTHVRHRGAAP